MTKPLVSIALICYNQARFIEEAMEGILQQRTDGFDMEVVVGDDCSTDGTAQILERYQENHPETIRMLHLDLNLGMHRNWENTIGACKGNYIAIIEGDDRWDDPMKLEKQVALLQNNPDASACFSNAKVLLDNGTFAAYDYVDRLGKDLDTAMFFELNFNPIPTCTTVFRAASFNGFPKAYYASPFADWILHTLLIQKGPYVYLNESSSSYRKHDGGVWSGVRKEKQLKNKLLALQIMKELVEPGFKSKVEHAIRQQLDDLLYFYRGEGAKFKFLNTWLKLKLA